MFLCVSLTDSIQFRLIYAQWNKVVLGVVVWNLSGEPLCGAPKRCACGCCTRDAVMLRCFVVVSVKLDVDVDVAQPM